MSATNLTFFCELRAPALVQLFSDRDTVAALVRQHASVSMGILDLDDTRAEVTRSLNKAGVPLIAWQLLPKSQGYWFNAHNWANASARYRQFRQWSKEHDLHWSRIGLDIESDIREMEGLRRNPLRLAPSLLWRALDTASWARAQQAYAGLIAEIHADGYPVDAYHLFVMSDERRAGSTLVQRLAGLVDIPADREVLMLYSSLVRPHGSGLLWSYAQHTQSVAVGVTGGGVELTSRIPPLTWEELARDLRLARRWTDDIHIFSLEGCVEHDYLERIGELDLTSAGADPPASAGPINWVRKLLQAALFAEAHPWLLLGLMWTLRCTMRRKKPA